MIRREKLNVINDKTDQVCFSLSQTGCNCECPDCQGTVDCVDCPGLTIADITMQVYRAGNLDASQNPVYILTYTAFTFQSPIACFFIDSQLIALPQGRYMGDIFVKGIKADNAILMQIGVNFSTCQPYILENVGTGNDMQI